MQKWYVQFPTYQYNEDVKALAIKNKLQIIDAKFQGNDEQCEDAPELTIKGTAPKAAEVKTTKKAR